MHRLLIFFILLTAAGRVCSLWAGDLETARAALHDRLYSVAQTHAEKALKNGTSDASQSLLVLLEALDGQGLYAEMLRQLEACDKEIQKAPASGAFAYWRSLALLNVGQPLVAAQVAEAEGSVTVEQRAPRNGCAALGGGCRQARSRPA